MKEVVIVSAVRTAVGSFGGTLKKTSAVTLGIHCDQGSVETSQYFWR